MLVKIQNKIIALFTDNLLLKIVSISCALTLWTWVQNQTVEEISLKALITYHYPEDVSIVTIPRQSVTVLLEGPQALLKGIKDTSLEIHIDASDASKGTTSYEFSSTAISDLPSGFRVLRISPPSIDLEFDTTMTRELRVEPNIVGTPPDGWELRGWDIEPSNITLHGATKIISNMDSIKTEVINIEQSKGNINKNVQIIQPETLTINNQPIYVNIQMNIDTVFQTKIFDEIPILCRDQNWNIDPQMAQIEIQGPIKDLQMLRADQITILIEKVEEKEDIVEMTFVPNMEQSDSKKESMLPQNISVILPNSSLMTYTIKNPQKITLSRIVDEQQ